MDSSHAALVLAEHFFLANAKAGIQKESQLEGRSGKRGRVCWSFLDNQHSTEEEFSIQSTSSSGSAKTR